jgi:hypothetical protein
MSNITFVFNHPIQVNERSTAALVREVLILKARGSCTLLSMGNCVYFKEERSLTFTVFMGENKNFVQNHRLELNGRKTAAFVRESLMLETRASRNLVNIVNSVCSLKEYCATLSVFLDEEHHLSAESPPTSEWEKHCSSAREALAVTSKRAFHLVLHGEPS